jgi:hypothetical protein
MPVLSEPCFEFVPTHEYQQGNKAFPIQKCAIFCKVKENKKLRRSTLRLGKRAIYGWKRATPRLILGYNLGKMRDLLIDTVCPCAYDGNELGFNKNLIKKQHGDAIQ